MRRCRDAGVGEGAGRWAERPIVAGKLKSRASTTAATCLASSQTKIPDRCSRTLPLSLLLAVLVRGLVRAFCRQESQPVAKVADPPEASSISGARETKDSLSTGVLEQGTFSSDQTLREQALTRTAHFRCAQASQPDSSTDHRQIAGAGSAGEATPYACLNGNLN